MDKVVGIIPVMILVSQNRLSRVYLWMQPLLKVPSMALMFAIQYSVIILVYCVFIATGGLQSGRSND